LARPYAQNESLSMTLNLTQLDTPHTNGATHERGTGTLAVHGGGQPHNPYHALTTPIVETATFTFRDTQQLVDYMRNKGKDAARVEYGRYGNPTIAAVEQKLAAVCGAEDALLYASGMAAVTSLLLTILTPGQHIIIGDDCYRHTRDFCTEFLRRYQVDCTVVPMGDYDALAAAVIPGKTRIIISESPTNPYMRVADLEQIVRIAKSNRILTLIDSTFATPINQQPLAHGIDFVMHSATKYLAGHNDLLAGVVVGKAPRIQALRESRGLLGGVVDPHCAYLLERGLKTLKVRVAHQNASALAIARYLEAHPLIERVWYPGLESHPDHAVASAQMTGFGGVVTFEVRGDVTRTSRFIDSMTIPYIAASLGGVESLIQQPALVSHFDKTPEERAALGIKDNLVRFSIGIEDTDDLIADLAQALGV
jgi:cystathionine gamma-synthase